MYWKKNILIKILSTTDSSYTYEYSYVLEKMGLEEQKFRNSIRLCIGRQNTLEEINLALNIITEKINLIKAV